MTAYYNEIDPFKAEVLRQAIHAACPTPLIEKGRERVGRLKMYGEAICVPVAQAFIAAAMEIIEA